MGRVGATRPRAPSPVPPKRTSRSGGPLVAALLRNPRGEARGEVTNLSPAGCAVDLGQEVGWSSGEHVLVELRSTILREPLRTLAVCGTAVRGILPLDFLEPHQVERELPHALVNAFNRRGAQRVAVDEEVRVLLRNEAEGAGGERRALLLDVSVGGLGLRLAPEAAREVAVGQRLALSFEVRRLEHRFELAGHVQSLWPAGAFVGCGVRFDAARDIPGSEREALFELIALCRADEHEQRRAG